MADRLLGRRCAECAREAVCDLTAGNSWMWPYEAPHLALCGQHFNAQLRRLGKPGVTLFFRWRDALSEEEPMPWRLIYPLPGPPPRRRPPQGQVADEESGSPGGA